MLFYVLSIQFEFSFPEKILYRLHKNIQDSQGVKDWEIIYMEQIQAEPGGSEGRRIEKDWQIIYNRAPRLQILYSSSRLNF